MPAQCRPFSDRTIADAARLILAGGVVAVPTETVYGLAADATNAAAVARIYAAKGRPSFNPLIVHVPDLAAAERIAAFDADARALAAAFWPGPLTLVLPLRPDAGIASLVTAGLDTIAVRVPRHPAMRALLAACGIPLAAPSANASNGISPTRAEHVARSLGDRVPLIIDAGASEAGLESTIVMGRRVLRPGPITVDSVEENLPGEGRDPGGKADVTLHSDHCLPSAPGPRLSPGGSDADGGGTAPEGVTAPGQLVSHYAPSKPLRLEALNAEADEYLIGFGAVEGAETLSVSGDLVEAAARLFDALHRADASDRARIAVSPIPREGIGVAINDRLARAAHG